MMLIEEFPNGVIKFLCPPPRPHAPSLRGIDGASRLQDLIDPLTCHSVALCELSSWYSLLVQAHDFKVSLCC